MPTPPGFADCSYEFTLTGFPRRAYCTFGVDCVSTNPFTVASQLVTAYQAAGSLLVILDMNAKMTGAHVSMGTDGTADSVGFANSAISGTSGQTESVPPNCALLVHKRTARGGRRGKGRMYLPWSVGESFVDEMGTISATGLTNSNTALTNWMAALTTGGNPLVVLHGPGKTPVVAPDPVTLCDADPIIGTQRRRLGR